MIPRTIYPQIIKAIQNRPVVLITGARQVGKSTICKKIMADFNFNYVSLDNIRNRQMAINDPEMFLQLHKWPLIIDEVQYAPKLFEVIESIVNKEKFETGKNYGMFILTASQTYQHMEGVSESMAGRVTIIKMSPLSKSEISQVDEKPFSLNIEEIFKRTSNYHISIDDLYESIVKGFYPELYDNIEIDPNQYFSDYIDTYINRDVSQIIHLKDKLKFQEFMEILASLTGEELVYDSISKEMGVSVATIQSWVSILVAADIIFLLRPYNENSILKRVVKRPKIYFKDTGLACFLSKLNNKNVLRASRFNGRFVETYIINEIMKSYTNNGKTPNFYYYRDNDQKEIDLIILDECQLNFIECKSGVSYKITDVSAFETLKKKTKYQVNHCCIICNTPNLYSLEKNVLVFPISAI